MGASGDSGGDGDGDDDGISAGAIVGIVLAAMAAGAAVLGLIAVVSRRRHHRRAVQALPVPDLGKASALPLPLPDGGGAPGGQDPSVTVAKHDWEIEESQISDPVCPRP